VLGFGGGLLSALAYVLVRNVFPEPLWPRVFGLLASVWSVTVLAGPLIGGVFAGYGNWRGAFVAVAGAGGLLALAALLVLPHDPAEDRTTERRLPVLRLLLISVAIAMLSLAGIAIGFAMKSMLIAAGVAACILMLRVDRAVSAPLLPSNAFTLGSETGTGMWMVFLLSIAYSPLAIYLPLFLQRLHGLSPLTAGYMVAGASLSWTAAALAVASLTNEWPPRLIVVGPIMMSAGLLGVAMVMAPGPVAALIIPIALIGSGIGLSWAFIAQHVMRGAKAGEENIAAASVATVQQAGIAYGAAFAGLVANASGLGDGLLTSVLRAAFWVPVVFVTAPVVATIVGVQLNLLVHKSKQPNVARS
jgi:predicted MFS family arabinose efflux permease